MKISQNKNKIYVKGLNKLEHDMLSTMKRYMETNNTQDSTTINNIVSEVMVRLKDEMIKSEMYPTDDTIK